jgi:hypothetical protein
VKGAKVKLCKGFSYLQVVTSHEGRHLFSIPQTTLHGNMDRIGLLGEEFSLGLLDVIFKSGTSIWLWIKCGSVTF